MANDAVVDPGKGPNVLEGARWGSDTITWSLASSAVANTADFSSYMNASYEAQVESAFATWASASGLKFVEVADSSASDIRIGWGNLDTAQTGAFGYTSYRASAGEMLAGAAIRLADPSLSATDTGQAAAVSFGQVLLHEIGHTLGLANDADVSSIMNYDLTSSNRSLDATDISAIHALYGSSTSAATVTTALLAQAMAGFGSDTAASVPLVSATDPTHQSLLAA